MSRTANFPRRAALVAMASLLVLVPAGAAPGEPGRSQVLARPTSVPSLPPSLPAPPDPSYIGPVTLSHPRRPPRPALMVDITHGLPITSKPGRGRVVGTMPAASPQFGFRTFAWVISLSSNGKYGRVPVPYSARGGTGWIPLRGLHRIHTAITVRADLSRHQITVERSGKVVLRMKAATGASWTPTPPGRYFVTDRVPFYRGSSYGSFAFGISNYQFDLPAGWHGGSQLAIHGTNDPGSIGRSVSAGCLRVSERSLALLKPLLRLGTPVIIQA